MRRLAEAQAALRDAIVAGDNAAILPMLSAGKGAGAGDPTYRLGIHQRHYEGSLADLLGRRFPALQWLVGEPYLRTIAHAFAREHPPRRPSLAVYGDGFPAYLAAQPGARAMPWLAEVGALEWHLGEVAAAIDRPSLGLAALTAFESVPLDVLHLRLQSGLAYCALDWPVDDLVRMHLEGNAPSEPRFGPQRVRLEVRGARGAFSMRRLDEPGFAFRRALVGGASLAAAVSAGEAAGPFDAGGAVAALFGEDLVTDIVAGEAAA